MPNTWRISLLNIFWRSHLETADTARLMKRPLRDTHTHTPPVISSRVRVHWIIQSLKYTATCTYLYITWAVGYVLVRHIDWHSATWYHLKLNIPDTFEYTYIKNRQIIERMKNIYTKIKTVPPTTARPTALCKILILPTIFILIFLYRYKFYTIFTG